MPICGIADRNTSTEGGGVPDAPSAWELQRRLDEMQRRLDERVVYLNTYQAERKADQDVVADLREDLRGISDRLTWAWRIALTGIILPVAVTIIGAIALVVILGGSP
jgi:hypothetical protein